MAYETVSATIPAYLSTACHMALARASETRYNPPVNAAHVRPLPANPNGDCPT